MPRLYKWVVRHYLVLLSFITLSNVIYCLSEPAPMLSIACRPVLILERPGPGAAWSWQMLGIGGLLSYGESIPYRYNLATFIASFPDTRYSRAKKITGSVRYLDGAGVILSTILGC